MMLTRQYLYYGDSRSQQSIKNEIMVPRLIQGFQFVAHNRRINNSSLIYYLYEHEYYFVVQITVYNYVWQVYTYQTKTMFSIYCSLLYLLWQIKWLMIPNSSMSARYPTLQATTYSIIYPPPNYHLISYYIFIYHHFCELMPMQLTVRKN